MKNIWLYIVVIVLASCQSPTKRNEVQREVIPMNFDAKWIGAIKRIDANLPEGRNWHSPSLKKNREFFDSIPELAKRSIMLRKEFELTKLVSNATIHISGLGHYELQLNGNKVGQSEFAPLWTDYDQSVFFNSYDVTDQLLPEYILRGKAAIGVILGNGMYNAVGDRYRKFWVSFGPPTLYLELAVHYEDGSFETFVSDQSWKYDVSPITFNDIFGGEDYDATLEQHGWSNTGFDDSNWENVVIQNAPKGKLKPQQAPPVKIREQFDIQTWKQIDSVTFVFDMEQNLAGFPSIQVKGKAGQKIKITPGERITEEGYVNQKNTGRPHFYTYTLSGNAVEEWKPRFSYYGYQYVQVEGISFQNSNSELPELLDLKSNFIYSDVEIIGEFECSNEIFTKTHTLINQAIKSNMQSVLTDCPHREKLGWLEQVYLNGPGLMYNYDLSTYLPKVMMDMADAQRPNGLVPNIAPEYVDFSSESWGADFTDSPEWGAAAVMVPWQYYQFYGDSILISRYYEMARGFVDYLTSRAVNGIVSHGLGDWYDYGEHRAGYSKNSPIALSATTHYYQCSKMVGYASETKETQQYYDSLTEAIKQAYNQKFFNPETNQYGTGSQYSNAVSLYMGLVEPENKPTVLDNLIADIKSHGYRLTTGDIGNRYLFQTLADENLDDLLFQMLNHDESPGYGYQVKYGLTTLTEQWDPEKGNSWNHFMLGQIEEWFFKSLAGIKPDPSNPGFKKFYIEPKLAGDLTYVKASTKSPYGKISVDWKIEGDIWMVNLEIPENSTATFILPQEIENAERQFKLEGGKHSFSYPMKP